MEEEEDIKPEIRKHFRPYRTSRGQPIEGCWDHDGLFTDIVYEFGDIWRNLDECNRKTCTRDGTILEEVCPKLEVPEGCIRLRGQTLEHQDFPYCCDRVVCPGDEEYTEYQNDWLRQITDRCDDKYCVRDIGEEWSEHKYGICNRKRCGRNEYSEPHIFEEKCPKVDVPKGCRLEGFPDLTKEFPDCCPKVVCPPGGIANEKKYTASNMEELLMSDTLLEEEERMYNEIISGGDTQKFKKETTSEQLEKNSLKVANQEGKEDSTRNSTKIENKFINLKTRDELVTRFMNAAFILFRKNVSDKHVKDNQTSYIINNGTVKRSSKSRNKKDKERKIHDKERRRKHKTKDNLKDQLDEETVIINANGGEKSKNEKYKTKDEKSTKAKTEEKLIGKLKSTKIAGTEKENKERRYDKNEQKKNKNKGKKSRDSGKELLKGLIKFPETYT